MLQLQIPYDSEDVDITTGDHTFSKRVYGVHAAAASGLVKVQFVDGTTATFYVRQGTTQPGDFAKVIKVGTAAGFASAAGDLVGVIDRVIG